MKNLLLGFMLIVLTACGSAGAGESMPPGPVGIHMDSTLDMHLENTFALVKQCTGLEKGEFSNLSIVLMPPSYKCPQSENICSGNFVPPNTILIGTTGMLGHEVIHYLLWLNTGDSDPKHLSLLYAQCQNPLTGTAVIGP